MAREEKQTQRITPVKVAAIQAEMKIISASGVLVNNRACGNQSDIKSEKNQNFGVKNSCGNCQNWQENGQAVCISSCN